MLAPLSELRKKPENQLTPAEKLAVFGEGTPGRVLYRQIKRTDGSKAVVSRAFGAQEKPGEDWKDSPAAFGVITHPSNDQRDEEAYDEVISSLPADAVKGRKAAE